MGFEDGMTINNAVGIDPIDQYLSLGFNKSLSKPSHYVFICTELSFLLRNAYSKFPKYLKPLIFQDTLYAFTLLPQMQTQSAISAAKVLLQSAEFALPKQKRVLAVAEYKDAVVATKRKSKTNTQVKGPAHLPQDVYVHIFSFLDVQSVLSASSVCWSWNAAACDNHLWELLYDIYFCNSDIVLKNDGLKTFGVTKNQNKSHPAEDIITGVGIDSRFAFKTAYKDACCKRSQSNRGYCFSCRSVVWLDRNKCSNRRNVGEYGSVHRIKPLPIEEIQRFILEGSLMVESSSDSDSDSDDGSVLKLWAYPKGIIF